MQGHLILSSIGLSAPEVAWQFKAVAAEARRAVIVTTAASGKETNQYAQLAAQQLGEAGLPEVRFSDLEARPDDLLDADVVYVCGGNTYRLMSAVRRSGFGEAVKSLLERGGTYLGVSAGSIIMTPSIRVAGEVLDDDNERHERDLTGLGVYAREIVPHYEPSLETRVAAYEAKYGVVVERLPNTGIIIT